MPPWDAGRLRPLALAGGAGAHQAAAAVPGAGGGRRAGAASRTASPTTCSELAGLFHPYYKAHRVITADRAHDAGAPRPLRRGGPGGAQRPRPARRLGAREHVAAPTSATDMAPRRGGGREAGRAAAQWLALGGAVLVILGLTFALGLLVGRQWARHAAAAVAPASPSRRRKPRAPPAPRRHRGRDHGRSRARVDREADLLPDADRAARRPAAPGPRPSRSRSRSRPQRPSRAARATRRRRARRRRPDPSASRGEPAPEAARRRTAAAAPAPAPARRRTRRRSP